MKKTIVTVVITILLMSAIWYIFKPVPHSENETKLEEKNRVLLDSVDRLQKLYDATDIERSKKEAELINSKAVVKLKEERLSKSLANERALLKLVKKQTLAMSEIQADSVIKSQLGPDSTSQKVVMKLAELSQCDSVREHQDKALKSYREESMRADSVLQVNTKLIALSRDQISVLNSSSQIDKQLLQSKDKQIRKLKRRERVLKIIVPVAFVLGVVLMI